MSCQWCKCCVTKASTILNSCVCHIPFLHCSYPAVFWGQRCHSIWTVKKILFRKILMAAVIWQSVHLVEDCHSPKHYFFRNKVTLVSIQVVRWPFRLLRSPMFPEILESVPGGILKTLILPNWEMPQVWAEGLASLIICYACVCRIWSSEDRIMHLREYLYSDTGEGGLSRSGGRMASTHGSVGVCH